MKQQIMEKLFSDTPLSTEEIMLINKTWKPEEGISSVTSSIPIDCSKTDVVEACGITEEAHKEFNKRMQTALSDKEHVTCMAEVVQTYENVMNESDLYKRIIILMLLKFQSNPLSLLLRGLM